LAKKWGILIKREYESLDFIGLEIPRDYLDEREEEKWLQAKNLQNMLYSN